MNFIEKKYLYLVIREIYLKLIYGFFNLFYNIYLFVVIRGGDVMEMYGNL